MLNDIMGVVLPIVALILVVGLIIRDLRNPRQDAPESSLEMTASVDNARDPEGEDYS